MKQVILSFQQLNLLVKYLSLKPYNEVFELINMLSKAAQESGRGEDEPSK